MEKINELKKIIDNSQRIVFFTGAGISCGSGIPDFRSSDGLYQTDLRAEEILSHDYFMANPTAFYAFYQRKMLCPDAKPNIAHQWIAKLENDGKALGVITQNIDGLHDAAGSRRVVELHGSVYRNHCLKCGRSYDLNKILSEAVPHCVCGGLIKPDVVLYGEPLDYGATKEAIAMITAADTLVIIGTSLNVYPAASFIEYYTGHNLIVLNKSATDKALFARLTINDDIIEILKQLSALN